MESLLNDYGAGGLALLVLGVALPLMLGGLVVRRRGRRRAGSVELARAARRRIGEVAAGLVTIEGRWRSLSGDGARGMVEDPGAPERRVLVERAASTPAIADGAEVTVVGVATHRVDDPRGAGYRQESRVWMIDAREAGHQASVGPGSLERTARAARSLSMVGAALFAAGLALAVATLAVGYRAAHDDRIAAPAIDE